MNQIGRGRKRLVSVVVIGLLVASLFFAATLPALSQSGDDDICVQYDDHGTCVIWLSDFFNPTGNLTSSSS